MYVLQECRQMVSVIEATHLLSGALRIVLYMQVHCPATTRARCLCKA